VRCSYHNEGAPVGSVPVAAGEVAVEILEVGRAEASIEIHGAGGSLVSQTFPWEDAPIQSSQDGGVTWLPSSVPEVRDGTTDEWLLEIVDGRPFLFGGRYPRGRLRRSRSSGRRRTADSPSTPEWVSTPTSVWATYARSFRSTACSSHWVTGWRPTAYVDPSGGNRATTERPGCDGGLGGSGGHVLISTDDGRTWSARAESRLREMRLSEPVVLGDRVVATAATNIEESIDVVAHVILDR